jgi:hypothetical protein
MVTVTFFGFNILGNLQFFIDFVTLKELFLLGRIFYRHYVVYFLRISRKYDCVMKKVDHGCDSNYCSVCNPL